nr:immunoglobulin heavy chain junction region [Mus musculus]
CARSGDYDVFDYW